MHTLRGNIGDSKESIFAAGYQTYQALPVHDDSTIPSLANNISPMHIESNRQETTTTTNNGFLSKRYLGYMGVGSLLVIGVLCIFAVFALPITNNTSLSLQSSKSSSKTSWDSFEKCSTHCENACVTTPMDDGRSLCCNWAYDKYLEAQTCAQTFHRTSKECYCLATPLHKALSSSTKPLTEREREEQERAKEREKEEKEREKEAKQQKEEQEREKRERDAEKEQKEQEELRIHQQQNSSTPPTLPPWTQYIPDPFNLYKTHVPSAQPTSSVPTVSFMPSTEVQEEKEHKKESIDIDISLTIDI